MKTLFRLVPELALLFALLGLIACNKEETVAPAGRDNRAARQSADALLNPAKQLLVKQDYISIARKADGAITRVTYSPHYYATYKTEVGQDPVFTRITAAWYSAGVKVRQNFYENKGGKTYHSVTTHYNPQTGAVAKIVHYGYEYNGLEGKLLRRYNINDVQDRTQFAYNLAGDLSKVEEYNPQGVLTKTTRFYYNLNAPADKYGFYPDSPAVDPFLQVLGVFAKKLPTAVVIDHADPATADASLGYQYTLDAHGYPSRRDTQSNGSTVATRTYVYKPYN